ncbi:MAG: hypothetical protein Q7U63_14700 [Polaromonas sp.]|nr:hypothetical protein [Polaromonas sp.]
MVAVGRVVRALKIMTVAARGITLITARLDPRGVARATLVG